MDAISGLLVAIVTFIVYFVPTIIAYNRNHHNTMAIAVLNLIFGFTGIGWGIALIWSLTAVRET